MSLLQTFRIAVRAVRRNKMRSFLTALGIIIGVSAVIAMMALGEGAKAQVANVFQSMGSNMLIVLPGSTTSGGARGGFGSMPTLTWADLKAIQSELSSVRYAAPELRTSAAVASEEQNWTTQVNGTTPDFFAIRNWKLASGALFSEADVEANAKVVVLGQTVVTQLYGASADPVGQVVRINKVPFQVVGVLAKKGQSAMGMDVDDAVFIPVTAYQTKIQGGLQEYVNGAILVGSYSPEATVRAETEISDLLRERHHLAAGAENDFSIRNLQEMASAMESSTATMTTLLAGIAAVSLLVGGIGIMNIMLVSVTERTREIGLRMAVGARPRHILAQFLVESFTLSVGGGLIGLIVGMVAAQQVSSRLGWQLVIQPGIVALAIGFSAVVGIGFGLYPATKASRLDPIQALHYE